VLRVSDLGPSDSDAPESAFCQRDRPIF